jgi:iron complex transport system substrate-binding protein
MIRKALALAALLALTAVPAAQAANGANYLASRLTPSGGFAEPGGSPSVSLTEWTVMALKAAGKNPDRMRVPGGHTPTYYLGQRAHLFDDAYALERGILAVVALGRNPRNFAGIDLVKRLRAQVTASGRIGRYANSTYWGVLAFRGAGVSIPRASIDYIRSQQQSNGGYAYGSGAAADSNDTAAAVMALRAGGIPCTWRAIDGAYRYMHSLQRSDHGYALSASSGSDSQSTGWVIQARLKCHLSNTGALSYLRARQLPSGAFEYRAGLVQTPAWVTAQVVPGIRGKAYPIR